MRRYERYESILDFKLEAETQRLKDIKDIKDIKDKDIRYKEAETQKHLIKQSFDLAKLSKRFYYRGEDLTSFIKKSLK